MGRQPALQVPLSSVAVMMVRHHSWASANSQPRSGREQEARRWAWSCSFRVMGPGTAQAAGAGARGGPARGPQTRGRTELSVVVCAPRRPGAFGRSLRCCRGRGFSSVSLPLSAGQRRVIVASVLPLSARGQWSSLDRNSGLGQRHPQSETPPGRGTPSQRHPQAETPPVRDTLRQRHPSEAPSVRGTFSQRHPQSLGCCVSSDTWLLLSGPASYSWVEARRSRGLSRSHVGLELRATGHGQCLWPCLGGAACEDMAWERGLWVTGFTIQFYH